LIRTASSIFFAVTFTLSAIACTTETKIIGGGPAPASTDPTVGTGDPDASDPETGAAVTPGSCVTVVTNDSARSPKPARGRKAESCTAKEIEVIFDPALKYNEVKAKLSAECAECAMSEQSDPTWGASLRNGDDAFVNVGACLRAQGEPGACADAVDIAQLCEFDSCAKCTDKARDKCVADVSAKTGVCLNLPKVKAIAGKCTEDIQAHLDLCNSAESITFMCGGRVDPLGCSSTTQVGTDVIGVVGTVVPTFAGGTIANGTWVATKIEGFGPGLGATVVGVTTRGTLTINGASYETIGFSSLDGKTKTSAGTQSLATNKVTQTQSCPNAQTLVQSFTATPTTLVMGLGFSAAAPNNGIVITYTKK
jgi:hypothetical protein